MKPYRPTSTRPSPTWGGYEQCGYEQCGYGRDSNSRGSRRSSGHTASVLPALLIGGLAALFLLTPGPRVPDAAQPHSELLVLGAAQYNGRPSPAFRERLDRALALYRAGGVRRIVVSGGVGRGDHYAEGQVGADYLRRRGVPAGALSAETRSRTTLENLRNSRSLLTGPVTLVTDEAHAARALALARATGLDADVSSVPIGPEWRYRLRERLALAAYTAFGIGSSQWDGGTWEGGQRDSGS